ncbi:hypothetical protein NXS15_02480 [Mycoplasma sp. CSL7475-4]|uniref:hypothetical protein n=1 Tax=Mycoplasma sp. CSL7475-4 TaxID=2973942 RepID=UPI00216ADC62|nr:hypothetical protein [Mycoplasma sp. CSL7475-4]MCS4536979.1 hypothetical protein [Mycoplasma sp. CSL7475-4]
MSKFVQKTAKNFEITQKTTNAWEQKRVADIIDYLRPDKYIVKDVDISENGKIPILTANKTPVLGWSNSLNFYAGECILFDDFTLLNKFINFPFVLKSSAIKILVNRNKDNNLYLIREILNKKMTEPISHKRHYIQEIQFIKILLPNNDEQSKVFKLIKTKNQYISLLQCKPKTG